MPGTLAIEQDNDFAARLENAEHLLNGLFGVVGMVQHAVGIDDVEGAVGKGQRHGIALYHPAPFRVRAQEPEFRRRRWRPPLKVDAAQLKG